MIIIRNSQLPWLVLIDKRIKFGLDLKPLFRDCPSKFGKRSIGFDRSTNKYVNIVCHQAIFLGNIHIFN